MKNVSAIVVARDEAELIAGCMESLKFLKETIVVIDDRTIDQTEGVVKKYTNKVYRHTFVNFSDLKNFAISKASFEWVLIVDADERIPLALAEEILNLSEGDADAYKVQWDNYFFGQLIKHGGWEQDAQIRLIRKELARYVGDIHETFELNDDIYVKPLKHKIVHFSHRSIFHNLAKTINYAEVQAKELLSKGHPPVTAKTFFGVIGHEFYFRMIKNRAYRDGLPGVIEGIYQPFSVFIIYAKLWELQQKPSLSEKYNDLERKINGK